MGSKETYQSKLNELQVLGSPIESRRNESETRQQAIESLQEAIKYYRAFVATTEEKYAHISEEQRQKVTDKINETEDWLNKLQAKQNELPKTSDPVLLTHAIEQRKEELTRFSNPIVNTPKPKPQPKKEPEPTKEEDKMQTDEPATNNAESGNEETPAEDSIPKPAEEGKIEEVNDNEPQSTEKQTAEDMDLD